MSDPDLDPFAVRPNAPISIVKSAKASLREPTRPQTPSSDLGRQLFGRDSAFAQNRPPSAYGVPGSKLFFENGPKLSIAKLESNPFARLEGGVGALGARKGSILEGAPGGGSADTWRVGTAGHRALSRSQSSQDPNRGVQDDSPRLLQHQVSGGRPTAAETVHALKANIAAAELGYRSPHQICDIDSTSDVVSPSAHRSPPSHVYPAVWDSNARQQRSPRGSDTAQVFEILHYDDIHDSSDSDYAEYEFEYEDAQPTAGPGSNRHHTHTHNSDSQAASASSGALPGTTDQPLVVLDPSDAFLQWRAETDEALQVLAAATGTLAATATQGKGGGGGGASGAVSQQEALAGVLTACSQVLACVVVARKQPHTSRWLDSSSAVYVDNQGRALSVRESITEHVFRLMDSTSPELLLKACSVVLRVVRTRGPLLQAGKLLYRLSKDSSNDAYFRREGLIEPMLRTVHVMVASTRKQHTHSTAGAHAQASLAAQQPHSQQARQQAQQHTQLFEPLVYYCGALKNVSNDQHNQRVMVKAGALHVLCQTLKSMVQHAAGSKGAGAPTAAHSGSASSAGPEQVAVQVTGILRNLAVSPTHAPVFISAGALTALKAALTHLASLQELTLNVARVLSKLSLAGEQLQPLIESDTEYVPLLVRTLESYINNGPLLLRLAFLLGNLTTNSDTCRMQVANVPGSLDLIVSTLHSHISSSSSHNEVTQTGNGSATGAHRDSAGSMRAGVLAGRQGQGQQQSAVGRTDCLVKLLRLVANLAIHPQVGPGLAARVPLAECLLGLLETYEYGGETEELVLNAVCAITNLSFYQQADNKILSLDAPRLLRPITPLLLSDNEEAVIEAARALGNLTRSATARSYLVTARVLEALVLLLDHSNNEVLYSVCGTLINFSADSTRQRELVQLGAVARLRDVLVCCAAGPPESDQQVSTLCAVCKVLFNLCAEGADSSGLRDQELGPLLAVLTSLRASSAWMERKDVSQVTARLLKLPALAAGAQS